MKKLLVLAALLFIVLIPLVDVLHVRHAFAEGDNPTSFIPGEGEEGYCDPTKADIKKGDLNPGGAGCGLDDFEKLLQRVIKYITFIVIPIAVGVIIYAGLVMMISGATGGEERISHAKKMMQVALWGIVIALGSYLIINSIFVALTGNKAEEKIQEINATP
jgi:hypothetical protein